MPPATSFRARAAAAAGDTALHAKLDHASLPFLDKRALAFAALPDGEARRDRARAAKAYAVAHLDTLLPALERRLTEHGCVVHWASDAAEACRIVLDVAARAGVRLVVKGKSMVSEEIALNASLEAAGLEAVETDLGEYIVQLAGVPPSHIITPAIHMSQDDVARLFSARLGEPHHDTAEALTAVARRVLREKFRTAGMGVTGVNVASAESGTLVVVENEGNGRMALTLPRIHLALMGIEKLVARDDDLAPMLEILPRSATGQTLTSYVSLVSGPRRGGEVDGPDEVHVVLLDNGRTRVLADPAIREALYCLRCGACLNACPVYRRIGGHAYGYAYSGPIGAVLAPGLLGIEQVPDLPFASTLCGACRDVCPVRIDIPRLLLTWRARATALASAAASERFLVRAWRRLGASPPMYRLLSPLAAVATTVVTRFPALIRLAPPLAAWARTRTLPAPSGRPFRARWSASDRGRGSDAA